MSKNNNGNLVQDLPLKKDGSVDFSKLPVDKNGMTEIDRSAEEAFENDTLTGVDLLGNEVPMGKSHDIMYEFLTGKEKPVDIGTVLSIVKHLQGKVLTVIDATFTDEKRLKYVKDLVKEQFSTTSNNLYNVSLEERE